MKLAQGQTVRSGDVTTAFIILGCLTIYAAGCLCGWGAAVRWHELERIGKENEDG